MLLRSLTGPRWYQSHLNTKNIILSKTGKINDESAMFQPRNKKERQCSDPGELLSVRTNMNLVDKIPALFISPTF